MLVRRSASTSIGTPLSASAAKTSRWCGVSAGLHRRRDRAQQLGVLDRLLSARRAVGEPPPRLVLERDLAALPGAAARLHPGLEQHELVRPGREPAGAAERVELGEDRGQRVVGRLRREVVDLVPEMCASSRGRRASSWCAPRSSSACSSWIAASRAGPAWRRPPSSACRRRSPSRARRRPGGGARPGFTSAIGPFAPGARDGSAAPRRQPARMPLRSWRAPRTRRLLRRAGSAILRCPALALSRTLAETSGATAQRRRSVLTMPPAAADRLARADSDRRGDDARGRRTARGPRSACHDASPAVDQRGLTQTVPASPSSYRRHRARRQRRSARRRWSPQHLEDEPRLGVAFVAATAACSQSAAALILPARRRAVAPRRSCWRR